MSTSFHPQTDGSSERANRSVGQIVRGAVRPDQTDWVDRIPMTEFAINISINDSTGFAPFELDGGYIPSMLKEIRDDVHPLPGVRAFAHQALLHLSQAHDALIESRVFQTHYANQRRREEPKITEGDLVYLSTKNLSLPKGRARKLLPKYIGPYKVEKARPETSDYQLELPEALAKRHLHPVFHVSLLRPHMSNNDVLFPNRSMPDAYDFGAPDEPEWFVDSIEAHRWNRNALEFQVKWSLGDVTWEPLKSVDKLMALDEYLALYSVKNVKQLPRKVRGN